MLFYIIIIAGHFSDKFPLFIFIFVCFRFDLSRNAPKKEVEKATMCSYTKELSKCWINSILAFYRQLTVDGHRLWTNLF